MALLLILLALLPEQETKEKTKSLLGSNTIIYNVLTSNKNILHGPYKIVQLGTEKVLVEGQMENGNKVGIWNFYDSEKKLLTYDYSSGEILANNLKDREVYVLSEGSYQTKKVDTLAFDPDFFIEFYQTLNYPSLARRMGVAGRVVVELEISDQGEIIRINSIQDIGALCFESAEKAIKGKADLKFPAVISGEPVHVKQYIGLQFGFSPFGISVIF